MKSLWVLLGRSKLRNRPPVPKVIPFSIENKDRNNQEGEDVVGGSGSELYVTVSVHESIKGTESESPDRHGREHQDYSAVTMT